MNKIFTYFHKKFMLNRMRLFLKLMSPEKGNKILDLGGYDGNVWKYIGENQKKFDIYIADIDDKALERARNNGFKTIKVNETGRLPFTDKEFDIVFCNSMIEHYTIPKSEIWNLVDDKLFKKSSIASQSFIANEIERISKKYFVQTPHRSFPIESHTQFPLTALLSRKNQIRLIKFLNKFWFKKTSPDWNLLGKKEAKEIFPKAKILINKIFFFPKEIIFYKN